MAIMRSGPWRDAGIVFLSVLVAALLVKTDALKNLLGVTQTAGLIGGVVAGIFYTSIFTSIPATAALVEISLVYSPFLTAFFAGLGALCGDFIVFRFVRGSILHEILHRYFQKGELGKLARFSRSSAFGWLVPVLGALIVASPFPDELGLTMMGLSRMRMQTFIPLSFLLNFGGILVIGLVARSVSL